MRPFSYVRFGLVLLGMALPCGAQDDPTCRIRIVPVTVADQKGKPVLGLTADRFRAQFRGQLVKIHDARMASGPKRMVILLDISGSMANSLRPKGIAWTIAGNAVESAPASTEVGLVLFNEKTRLRVDPSLDRALLLQKLRDATTTKGIVKGRTALRDAIAEGIKMLGGPRLGDVIYLISDGGDNMSWMKESEFSTAVRTANARIFGILLADPFPSTAEERAAPALMSDLANMTGGVAVIWTPDITPGGRRNLDSIVRRLYFDMQNYYQLTSDVPIDIDKPRDWKLDVVDEQGRKMGEYDVFSTSEPWLRANNPLRQACNHPAALAAFDKPVPCP